MSKQQICNFRAQTSEDWRDWKWFVHYCKSQGLTTCRPLIAFIRAFRRGMEGLSTAKPEVFNGFPVIVQLQQQNTFVYSLEKPRRTPDLSCYLRNNFVTATTSRRMAEAYVLQKAEWLYRRGQRTFCFRDFIELKHGTFRKLILSLKRHDEVIPVDPRTCPRFYMLATPPRTTQ
ncbi:MAG: hypothetical protein ACE5L6_02125 [Candidatus Bathyarchaeia archaeon]